MSKMYVHVRLLSLVTLFFDLITRSIADDRILPDNTPTWETRGYYKREHSLIKPYQGSGMDIPFWDIVGSTMVTPQYIRLTADLPSRLGAIWNRMPIFTRDWEIQVTFKVHGSTGELFGDGFAMWYAKEKGLLGPVFGSKDYFRGLGVFLDTYSNHNGPHSHGHPFISSMVSNGSAHYDHDKDGTHTQLGGDDAGCEAKFRNKDYDTSFLVRYVGDTLSIYTDIHNMGIWQNCVSVPGVRLPTGFHIGLSAATGELSDTHDVVSVKFYEQEYARAEKEEDIDRENIDPYAQNVAAPRDHIDTPRPSKLGWIGTIFLFLVGIAALVVFLGFGFVFLQKRQENNRKRFY